MVLEGDETGQELLDEALRVLATDVVGSSSSFRATTSPSKIGVRRRTRSSTRPPAPFAITAWAQGRDDHARGARTTSEARTASSGRRSVATSSSAPVAGSRESCRSAGPSPHLGRAHGGGRCLRGEGMAGGRRRGRGGLPHDEDRAANLPRGRGILVPPCRAHEGQGVRRPQIHGQPRVRGDAQGGDGRRRRAPSRSPLRAAADRRHLCAPDQRRRAIPSSSPL